MSDKSEKLKKEALKRQLIKYYLGYYVEDRISGLVNSKIEEPFQNLFAKHFNKVEGDYDKTD